MFQVALTVVFAVLAVVLAEWLWLKEHIRSEANRKLIHVAHGLLICVWPFFVSYKIVALLEVFFILLVLVDKKMHIIHGASAIARITWGEFLYPVGIIAIALMEPNKWVFVVAVLHLALADAAAALIGTRYGGNNTYHIFRQKKSLAGSFGFFVVSILLVLFAFLMIPDESIRSNLSILFLLPLATTFVENIGTFGLDNLLIPVTVVLLLG